MREQRFVIIDDGRPVEVPAAVEGGKVRLATQAVEVALGWALTSEGLCRGQVCVPLPPGVAVDGRGVDLAGLAVALRRPLAVDVAEGAAYLGASADDRARTLASLDAPDFTLPDLDGRRHSLSDHRGRKVLFVVYASW